MQRSSSALRPEADASRCSQTRPRWANSRHYQAAIVAQISKAVDDAMSKLEKRKAELIAGYNMRKEKLQQAAKLAGEALS